MTTPVLELNNVSKSYGTNLVLDNVTLTITSGSIHTFFGGNGAGKSTLVKIISGVLRQFTGELRLLGALYRPISPAAAYYHGIATVYQDFSLIPSLNAVDNIFLGRELTFGPLLDRSLMLAQTTARLHELGLDFPVNVPIDTLSRATQQLIEIAKVIFEHAHLLILDEPTSSLSTREVKLLFKLLKKFVQTGGAVIFISHKLQEILSISDYISIFRDGSLIDTINVSSHDQSEIKHLLGVKTKTTTQDLAYHSDVSPQIVIKNLIVGHTVSNLDLTIRPGEILALTGLVGSGITEVAKAIFGLVSCSYDTYTINGLRIATPSPLDLVSRGVIYVPSDRLAVGLLTGQSIMANFSITSLRKYTHFFGFITGHILMRTCTRVASELQLKYTKLQESIHNLSGGNQQKVVLGRGLVGGYVFYILDEPTVGVDIETRELIYDIIRRITAAGASVLLISTDWPEIRELADRLMVFYEGSCVYISDNPASETDAYLNTKAMGLS